MSTNKTYLEKETLITWAQKIQAISQNGLAYSQDKYDRERFADLHALSIQMMAAATNKSIEIINNLFLYNTGYATPKIDIRVVIFHDKKMLLVQEENDNTWSLPGGWADIGLSPSDVAIKEVKEEAGLDIIVDKVLGIVDMRKHGHHLEALHVYKIFIQGTVVGGKLSGGLETSAATFFGQDELPPLSIKRNTKELILEMFKFLDNPRKKVLLD